MICQYRKFRACLVNLTFYMDIHEFLKLPVFQILCCSFHFTENLLDNSIFYLPEVQYYCSQSINKFSVKWKLLYTNSNNCYFFKKSGNLKNHEYPYRNKNYKTFRIRLFRTQNSAFRKQKCWYIQILLTVQCQKSRIYRRH